MFLYTTDEKTLQFWGDNFKLSIICKCKIQGFFDIKCKQNFCKYPKLGIMLFVTRWKNADFNRVIGLLALLQIDIYIGKIKFVFRNIYLRCLKKIYFVFDIEIKNSSVDYKVKFYAYIQVHYEAKQILSSSLMIKMTNWIYK